MGGHKVFRASPTGAHTPRGSPTGAHTPRASPTGAHTAHASPTGAHTPQAHSVGCHHAVTTTRGWSWGVGVFIPSTTTLLTTCIVLMLTCTTVQGEEECSSNVMCYECSSWTHPLCDDPFNFTLSIEKGPPVASCDGCCVKLVQNIGTPYASIRRTCTEKLQINLFMVDHVCMMEGGGHGHMCFCEEDLCNAAPSSLRAPLSWASLLLPLLSFLHAFRSR